MTSIRKSLDTPPTGANELGTKRHQQQGAWSLPVIIPVVVLVLIGGIWRSLPEPPPQASLRKGAIALHQKKDANQETEYFDEQDFTRENREEADERQEDDSAAQQSKELSPPSGATPLALNDIQLPGNEASRLSPTNVALGDPLAESKISSRLPGDPVSEQFLKEERARLDARKPIGPVGKVSLFGSDAAQGRSFVFVIDRSKSMGGQGLNALVAAQHQLQSALAGLKETHRFQIVAYHHKRVYFHPTAMVRVTAGNASRVNEFFGNLLAVGGTDHHMAVLAGLRFKPDVLFILNDGGHPELNAGQLGLIRRRAAGRTTIHTIQFGLGPMREETSFMQRLAQQNGGNFHYVNLRQ